MDWDLPVDDALVGQGDRVEREERSIDLVWGCHGFVNPVKQNIAPEGNLPQERSNDFCQAIRPGN